MKEIGDTDTHETILEKGKSTLADRLLESTKTVSQRDMTNQLLDNMDLVSGWVRQSRIDLLGRFFRSHNIILNGF